MTVTGVSPRKASAWASTRARSSARQVEIGRRRGGGGEGENGGAQAHSNSSGRISPLGPCTKWWKARWLSGASLLTSQAVAPAARAWRTSPAAG